MQRVSKWTYTQLYLADNTYYSQEYLHVDRGQSLSQQNESLSGLAFNAIPYLLPLISYLATPYMTWAMGTVSCSSSQMELLAVFPPSASYKLRFLGISFHLEAFLPTYSILNHLPGPPTSHIAPEFYFYLFINSKTISWAPTIFLVLFQVQEI